MIEELLYMCGDLLIEVEAACSVLLLFPIINCSKLAVVQMTMLLEGSAAADERHMCLPLAT
jgi:hypothetical protein